MYEALYPIAFFILISAALIFFLEVLPKWYKKEVIDPVDEEQLDEDRIDWY